MESICLPLQSPRALEEERYFARHKTVEFFVTFQVFQVWYGAMVQVIFSLALGFGTLPSQSSSSYFSRNVIRYATLKIHFNQTNQSLLFYVGMELYLGWLTYFSLLFRP